MPGEKILVVDDDRDAREFLSAVLSMSGFEPITAQNGEEALETARRERPATVLLDLMMPVRDGLWFLQQRQKDALLSSIPVVVLSAFLTALPRAESLGAQLCMPKPVDVDQVIATVERLVH